MSPAIQHYVPAKEHYVPLLPGGVFGYFESKFRSWIASGGIHTANLIQYSFQIFKLYAETCLWHSVLEF